MPLVKCDQRSPEWFEARRGKITASIAAACLRLDPHTSAAKAWRIVTGNEEDRPTTFWMEQGVVGEPLARNAYECDTGRLALETGFWVHDHFGWLGASPDALVGSDGMVEFKVPRELPASVPIHHRIQCIIGMLCARRSWCDYMAWTPHGYFIQRIYVAGESGLLMKLLTFYREFVVPGIEPGRKIPKKRKKKTAEASDA
jgi:putative phage-type endonuclease